MPTISCYNLLQHGASYSLIIRLTSTTTSKTVGYLREHKKFDSSTGQISRGERERESVLIFLRNLITSYLHCSLRISIFFLRLKY
jgi:hypothetical protein